MKRDKLSQRIRGIRCHLALLPPVFTTGKGPVRAAHPPHDERLQVCRVVPLHDADAGVEVVPLHGQQRVTRERQQHLPQTHQVLLLWTYRGELSVLVMPIGNPKFGIPRKYQNQIGIWYFGPKFLGIFLVFYRYLENDLIKTWLNIGIFGQNKNRFGIWFRWLPFHWYRFGFGW